MESHSCAKNAQEWATRCALQSRVKIPSQAANVESHPNVEGHDVRMGHPATQNQQRKSTAAGEGARATRVTTQPHWSPFKEMDDKQNHRGP